MPGTGINAALVPVGSAPGLRAQGAARPKPPSPPR